MAVTRLTNYYPRHTKRAMALAVVVTCVTSFLLIIILSQILALPWIDTFYILIAFVLLQFFAITILLRYALEPLEILTRAITHISDEPNDVIPPTLNEPRHVRTGLKRLVQTLYDNASTNVVADTTDDTKSTLISQIFNMMPCGIIALDEQSDIILSNKAAPIKVSTSNQPMLDLLFEKEPTLSQWIEQATKDKMTDDHFWPSVENKPLGEDNRQVFDIYAHYEKGHESKIATVLLTFDRTNDYGTDEKALDFISVAAHELRGPITIIRGYLDVLSQELKPTLQDDQYELINRLDVSASRLSSYVNNILNVAKYDRRHLKLHLQQDTMQNIMASIMDDIALRAKTQNRLISIKIPDDLPPVAADRTSIGEVITNLVDNALKYSYEGGQVSVTAELDGDFVKCLVRDYGVGMPMSVMSNLFKKFYRSHRSRSSVVGTGLGLYISKAIVESHGGRVGVSSREGQGSTFSFTIPTYDSVADKIISSNNNNTAVIQSASGWIRNHAKIEG